MSAKLQTPDAGVIAAGVSRLGMRKDVWSASGGGGGGADLGRGRTYEYL